MAMFEPWAEMERARREDGHDDQDEDALWLRLLSRVGCWSNFGFGFYSIFDRSTGSMVGEAGLQARRRGLGPAFEDAPEAAWAISRTYQRKGYGAEAMGALIDHCVKTMRALGSRGDLAPINRIVALVEASNRPSGELAIKLGFAKFDEVSYVGKPHLLFELPLLDRAPVP